MTTRTIVAKVPPKILTLRDQKQRFAVLAGASGHEKLAPWSYFTDKRVDSLLMVEADATLHAVHFLLSVWDPQMPKATPQGEFRLHEALRTCYAAAPFQYRERGGGHVTF